MREFQERKNRKKKLYSVWTLLFLLVVIFLLTRGVLGVYEKEKSTKIDLQHLESQKADLENRYDAISKQANTLQTEAGLETAIREKFDVAKKGEGVIVIVDKTVEKQIPKKGFVDKVWDTVKGVFH
jgi:cell division protein FtsB